MNKSNRIDFKGTVDKFASAIAHLQKSGDCTIVQRGAPRTIVIMCPDGCGETIAVNLDPRIGKAWRKYDRGGKLTIYPSVWRDTGCRAHFIVWNDQIIWCNANGSTQVNIDDSFVGIVYGKLSSETYIHFEAIAENMGAIPWDVLWACNILVRRGNAEVVNQSTFKRTGKDFSQKQATGRIDFRA